MLKKKVLVFCRPYLVNDFQKNIDGLSEEFEFKFITDGKKKGITDTRARFYANLDSAPMVQGFTQNDESNVISRCRYLRNIPRSQAIQMLRSMALVLIEELESFQPDVVYSHMVDDYVTHLLAELSRLRGLMYVGIAYSYFPGKMQITQYGYGLPLDIREPEEEEIRTVLEQISKPKFRQNYLQADTYTPLRHLKAMIRYRVKQIVFAVKGRLENDPLHMHYACLPFVVERRRWRDFPNAEDFHGDWRSRINTMGHQSGKPIIYIPLSYIPEATSDYWMKNLKTLRYQELVIEICKELSPHFCIVVKEHLHMLGARDSDFYKTLVNLEGVISVPAMEFSNDVLAMVDVVLMGAGSIGVEAYLRGKAIVSFSDQSYWFPYSNAAYIDVENVVSWPIIINNKISSFKVPTEEEKYEFVRQCLRSTMRQGQQGITWHHCDKKDLIAGLNKVINSSSGKLTY
ncbi:hypothetical protein [Undibacterium crateris]|uniref:hypothetical protein n=1 Tax=Undibacterium crateris TaxID=2528175 RepID=UPI00138987A1|nr:hypothetical protein [Undibacterium crateris]NDI84634.1 hypothetical protein [Undibacterium crateris]